MTVDQMIRYLRLNVSIQDPTGATEQDSAYLSMTDEDILLYLNVVLSRDFPDVPSLEYLPSDSVYAVILLAKKELYYALAVKESPLYDLGADNNNYLKRSQRFDHYMKLIGQVDKEYQDYLDDGGAGGNTLTSFDVLLPDRYATRRNFEKGVVPAPLLYVTEVTDTSASLEWRVRLSRFFRYRVYVSKSPIVDLDVFPNPVSKEAILAAEIKDVHQTRCRVEGLEPDTPYHVAVSASEMSSLTGYSEVSFTTLPSE